MRDENGRLNRGNFRPGLHERVDPYVDEGEEKFIPITSSSNPKRKEAKGAQSSKRGDGHEGL